MPPPLRNDSAQRDRLPRHYPRGLFPTIGAAVALHLNYWLWDSDELVLGLPVNLFYHVMLTLALAVFMLTLVRGYWPAFLDDEDEERE